MKKRICILLTVCMLLICVSTVVPVMADDDTVDVITFNSLADFQSWERRGFSVSDNFISSDVSRVGDYSLRMVDLNIEYSFQTPVNYSIMGMSYINVLVYCDSPNNVTVDFRPKIGGRRIQTLFTIPLDFKGWKVFSFPLSGNSGNLLSILFSTQGYGFGARGEASSYPDNTVDKLTAACYYLNHVWLSKDYPSEAEFTGSTVKDGAKLVKHNLPKISLTAPGISPNALNTGNVTIEPEVAFHTEIDDGYLNIMFDENLTFATDYTVSVDGGFFDKHGMSFSGKTISFRTRGENDNIPPEVEVISPASGERFFPGDTVTLTARATDEDGSIQYVEFYCDGELIEGSRTTSKNDEYSFEWSSVKENLNGNVITALACDNKGKDEMSDGVKIKIAGYHNPTIAFEKPERGTSLYSSISGIPQPISLELAANASDIDGTVESVSFYLDDELIYTETNDTAAVSYTFTDPLDAGEHVFRAVVEDNDGLTYEDARVVKVIDLGKEFPPVKVKVTSTDYKTRKSTKNLGTGVWQADARLVVRDNQAHKFVTNGASGYEMMTFTENGSITLAGKVLNVERTADGIYDVKIIVDADKGVLTCDLNGKTIIQGLSVTGFTEGVSFTLEDAVEDQAYIDDLNIYRLSEAAQLSDIVMFDESGNTVSDTSAIDVYTDSILVEFEGGVSEETLSGNVSIIDKLTGEIIPTVLKGSKTYLLSKLKSDYEYLLRIGSNVSDANGKGLSGDQTVELKTKKNPVTVRYSSGLDALASDTTNVSAAVSLTNNTADAKKCVIIVAVYEGSLMKQFVAETADLAADAQTDKNISVDLENSVTEDTSVEIFVVDSEETLLPVSDTIFRLVFGN